MAVTVAVAVEFVGLTLALVDGFHDSKAPADENAAKCWCETPLAVVNEPPTYTVELFAVTAFVLPFRFPVKVEISAPVAVEKAAMWLWVALSTLVKSPTTYTVEPLGDAAMARP